MPTVMHQEASPPHRIAVVFRNGQVRHRERRVFADCEAINALRGAVQANNKIPYLEFLRAHPTPGKRLSLVFVLIQLVRQGPLVQVLAFDNPERMTRRGLDPRVAHMHGDDRAHIRIIVTLGVGDLGQHPIASRKIEGVHKVSWFDLPNGPLAVRRGDQRGTSAAGHGLARPTSELGFCSPAPDTNNLQWEKRHHPLCVFSEILVL